MLPVHEIIAGHPFLSDLPNRMQQLLTASASRTQFRANQVIFREGEEADSFYLIGPGAVLIEAFVPGHGRIVLQTLHEGDVLGWSWLFPPYRWHLDARAVEETQAVVVHVQDLRRLCASDHELACELMKRFVALIVQRLQVTRMKLLDLYAPPQQVAKCRQAAGTASKPLRR